MTDGDATAAVGESAGERPAGDAESSGCATVSAHRSAPGRTVFTEQGNTDGWIASSLTLSPPR